MSKETKEILEFGPFTLDRSEARLLRDGSPVSLPPKVFDLLFYMASNAGRLIEKDELLKALWPDSFVEEANLTVGIAALRKALGPEWIETVPKRGYRFVGEIRRPEAPIEKATIIKPVSKRRLSGYWLILPVGILIGGVILLMMRRPPVAGDRSPQLVAVLPFSELSSSEENAHIGLGMADALIMRLSASHELAVRPITTVRKYDSTSVDPISAGKELGASVVIFGTVQVIDKRVRLNVQLMRVADGQTLWSDKFDEFYTNIFAIQDTISERLANTLALRLSSEEQNRMVRRYTENTQAFRLYEIGRYKAFPAPIEALGYFDAALKEDPRYALPYVDQAFIRLNFAGGGGSRFNTYMPLAREAAKKALDLAPDYADAHAAMAGILHAADRDYAGARREVDAALKLNPQSARAHDRLAEILAIKGELEAALVEERMAAGLDPFNGELAYNVSWILYCMRRYDDAINTMEEFERRDPRGRDTYVHYNAYLRKSRYDDALARLDERSRLFGSSYTLQLERAYIYALSGKKDEARNLVTLGPSNERSYERAIVYMALGDLDTAFERLNRAIDEHSVWAEWFKVDPALDPIRNDARFAPLIRRMGLE